MFTYINLSLTLYGQVEAGDTLSWVCCDAHVRSLVAVGIFAPRCRSPLLFSYIVQYLFFFHRRPISFRPLPVLIKPSPDTDLHVCVAPIYVGFCLFHRLYSRTYNTAAIHGAVQRRVLSLIALKYVSIYESRVLTNNIHINGNYIRKYIELYPYYSPTVRLLIFYKTNWTNFFPKTSFVRTRVQK